MFAKLSLTTLAALMALAVLIPSAAAGTPAANTVVYAPNTTALRALPTAAAYGGIVIRLTDGAAGAPPQEYTPGASTCATDDGATCIDSSDGKSWQIVAHTAVDARQFGVVFDGATDNATTLQTMLNWAINGKAVTLPCGTAVFNTALSVGNSNANLSYMSITGQGDCSLLLYSGANTTNDIIEIGNLSTTLNYQVDAITLAGFRIDTTTQMTAGAALHLRHVVWSRMSPTIGGQYGNGKFYNGVWFDECDIDAWPNTQIGGASQDNVLVNGSLSTESWYPNYVGEVRLTNGKISSANAQAEASWPKSGIHIAGGVGGFSADNIDDLGNVHDLLVDNAITGNQNQTAIFGSSFNFDAAQSDCIVLNDSAALVPAYGSFKALYIYGWVASAGYSAAGSATANGILVTSFLNGQLTLNGYEVGANKQYGLDIQDASTTISIGAAETFSTNTSGDIASTVASPKLKITNARLASTTPLDTHSLGSTLPIYAGPFAWTPGITFGTNAVGITYSTRLGSYELHGMLVEASYDLTLSSKGSSTGAAALTGQPVGVMSGTAGALAGGGIVPYATAFASLSGPVVTSMDAGGGLFANIYGYGGSTGGSNLTASNFTNTTALGGMLTYTRP